MERRMTELAQQPWFDPYLLMGRDATAIIDHSIAVVGAGSGIGQAVAARLSRGGALVTCLDIDSNAAEKTAAELRNEGLEVADCHLDVADADTIAAGLAFAESVHGPLHALVNCAGITGVTNVRTEDVPIDDFDRVVSVNLRGAFLLSRMVLPGLRERGYGRVLHLASIAGKEGNAGMVAYSATKAGLIGMVKAQGKEYATTGVTINAVAPAVIRTSLVDAMPAEQVSYMTDKIPMGRTASLDEISELIAWAVSPAASFTTGFTYDLSGGRAVY